MLGILIGFILTVILIGISAFFLYPTVSQIFGLPGASQPIGNGNFSQQPQNNGTLFGCPELKLVGTETVKSGVPFTIQNTDSKPHKITISGTEYSFVAGEKKQATINGKGIYHPGCDGSFANPGELNVGE